MSPTVTAPATSPSSPTIKTSINSQGTGNVSSPSKVKSSYRVSFKDRIKSLQQSETSKQEKVSNSSNSDTSDMKQHLIPIPSPTGGSSSSSSLNKSSSSSKPSTAQAIKDRLKSFGHFERDDGSIKPWSKLKLATVVGGSYSSLQDDSPVTTRPKSGSGTALSDSSSCKTTTEITMFGTVAEQVSVSDSELKNMKKVPKMKTKPRPIRIDARPKFYQSVDDLSPEYSGLPFVKKLKILNERQKLAELESVIQTRSFSLDCTESTNAQQETLEPLYRSYSEASCIVRSKAAVTTLHGQPLTTHVPLEVPQCLKSPMSPESNETYERRQLKSILKRLSEDKAAATSQTGQLDDQKDIRKLMRAQTVEGYVARRKKFMKSVSFNRNTLSSPPSSANISEPVGNDRTLFPIPDTQFDEALDEDEPAAQHTETITAQHVMETEIQQVESIVAADTPPKTPLIAHLHQPNNKKLLKGRPNDQNFCRTYHQILGPCAFIIVVTFMHLLIGFRLHVNVFKVCLTFHITSGTKPSTFIIFFHFSFKFYNNSSKFFKL